MISETERRSKRRRQLRRAQQLGFKTQLDARWAFFFDAIGWEWKYEPFEGRGFTPTFQISGKCPFLVCVEPASSLEDLREIVGRIEAGIEDSWDNDILLVGKDPFIAAPNPDGVECQFMGLSGELCFGEGRAWAYAGISLCEHPNKPRVCYFDTLMSYAHRPCGCWDGDHFLCPIDQKEPPFLRPYWDKACKEVRDLYDLPVHVQ